MKKKKFGILGAMPQEVALMARSMTIHREIDAGMRVFYEGEWMGQDIVLALSRVGKVSAAVTTMLLLERFEATHIIFTGVAGAIDPRLKIGDVVIGDRLVQHDMDASPLPAFQRFEIPLLGKIYFETPDDLLAHTVAAAQSYSAGTFIEQVAPEVRQSFGMETPTVYQGLIASGDQFLADPGQTAALRAVLPDTLCTEMEGAAVAQVCYEMGNIPAAVIRVISDQADHSAVVDFLRFINEIAENLTGGIVQTLLESYSKETA